MKGYYSTADGDFDADGYPVHISDEHGNKPVYKLGAFGGAQDVAVPTLQTVGVGQQYLGPIKGAHKAVVL